MPLRERVEVCRYSPGHITLPLAWLVRAGRRYVAAGLRLPGRRFLYVDWGRAPHSLAESSASTDTTPGGGPDGPRHSSS